MPEINSALAKRYVAQVEKENRWLPYLAEPLQTPISRPIAMGKPCDYYPCPWSVMAWLEGETASLETVIVMDMFTRDVADFLIE